MKDINSAYVCLTQGEEEQDDFADGFPFNMPEDMLSSLYDLHTFRHLFQLAWSHLQYLLYLLHVTLFLPLLSSQRLSFRVQNGAIIRIQDGGIPRWWQTG